MSRMSRRREMGYAEGVLMELGYTGQPEREERTIETPPHYFDEAWRAKAGASYSMGRLRLDFGELKGVHAEMTRDMLNGAAVCEQVEFQKDGAYSFVEWIGSYETIIGTTGAGEIIWASGDEKEFGRLINECFSSIESMNTDTFKTMPPNSSHGTEYN